MMVFTCLPDFEAMMTCIYDAWDWALKNGHENLRLELEPIIQPTFFDTYMHIEADPEKVEKVVRSIQRKISYESYIRVYYACLCEEDLLDVIYRYLRIGFRVGARVDAMLTEAPVMKLTENRRKIGNESHYFREFMRFSCVDGKVYVAHFEPKSNVVYLVARHFADRMPSEHWMIIDDTRRLAVVHPCDQEMYLRKLEEEEFEQLRQLDERRDEFTELWQTFFDTIAIKERENRKCQRNMMPIWMRKHAPEFQGK